MTKQSFSIKSYVNKHLRNHLKKTKTKKDLANTACKVSSHEKTAATYSPTGVQYHRRGRA